MTGIYKIQSKKKPERIYIGSAINILDRWAVHKYQLQKNKHHSIKLQRHYNKYGWSDLKFTIIIGCDLIDMIEKEQFFIDLYNPYFNVSKRAGSQLGRVVSDETREKIRKKLLGRKLPDEVRLKMSTSRMGHISYTKGIKRSEESKQKTRLSMLGKSHKNTEETKIKISNSLRRYFANRRLETIHPI